MALLVVLHGHGDEPDATLAALDLGRAVGLPGPVAVVAPRGPTRAPTGPAWFPSGPDDEGPPLTEALEALGAAEADWRAQARLPTRAPTVLVGYSQGAAAALAAAATLATPGAPAGRRPLAVVGAAAFVPDAPGLDWDLDAAVAGGVPVRLVHGEDDEVVDPLHGRSAWRLLERAGLDATFTALPGVDHRLAGPLAGAAVAAVADLLATPPT